ncbi:MAG: hypothetical protein B6U72_01075 [Candidatus Altiarchaeales archaeon ex4484_2]|nr:MAG: hypothetical protein B6U72_01075 [Candidatus Altiarchaeales archaeon ex4484_2]
MIDLDDIWTDIREDRRFMKTRFNSLYLREIGGLLDRRGFIETKLHLWDNTSRDDLRPQASILISIISRLERDKGVRKNNGTGGYILKELSVLKSLK